METVSEVRLERWPGLGTGFVIAGTAMTLVYWPGRKFGIPGPHGKRSNGWEIASTDSPETDAWLIEQGLWESDGDRCWFRTRRDAVRALQAAMAVSPAPAVPAARVRVRSLGAGTYQVIGHPGMQIVRRGVSRWWLVVLADGSQHGSSGSLNRARELSFDLLERA